MMKLIHPDNPQDVAIVDPGSEAEQVHRARGLVSEAELEAPAESEPPAESKAAVAGKAKSKGKAKG